MNVTFYPAPSLPSAFINLHFPLGVLVCVRMCVSACLMLVFFDMF